jgi:hypothetical protein
MADREGFQPTTIGLKAICLIYQVFNNQSLTAFVRLQRARKRQLTPVRWMQVSISLSIAQTFDPGILSFIFIILINGLIAGSVF